MIFLDAKRHFHNVTPMPSGIYSVEVGSADGNWLGCSDGNSLGCSDGHAGYTALGLGYSSAALQNWEPPTSEIANAVALLSALVSHMKIHFLFIEHACRDISLRFLHQSLRPCNCHNRNVSYIQSSFRSQYDDHHPHQQRRWHRIRNIFHRLRWLDQFHILYLHLVGKNNRHWWP